MQRFSRDRVSMDATLVVLAAIAISVPSLFSEEIEPDFVRVESVALATAAVVLVLYVLFIIYSLRQPQAEREHIPGSIEPSHTGPHWPVSRALIVMVLAIIGLALMSEFLVGSLDIVTESFGAE